MGEWIKWMVYSELNEYLTTPQHKNYIGCWVSDNGM